MNISQSISKVKKRISISSRIREKSMNHQNRKKKTDNFIKRIFFEINKINKKINKKNEWIRVISTKKW